MASDDLEALLIRKDMAGAEAACLRLLAEHPEDAMLWEFRGRTACIRGDLSHAEAYFERAMDLNPHAPEPVFGLARCAARRRKMSKAAHHARRALALGLSGDRTHLAKVWLCYGLLGTGQRADGLAALASYAPWFAQLPDSAFADDAFVRGALAAAAAANDMALAERFFRLRASERTAILSLTCAPVATVAGWCVAHDVSLMTVENERPVAYAATTPYSVDVDYRAQAARMTSLAGGQWVPGWDFVIASDGTVLSDSGYLSLTAPMGNVLHFDFAQAALVIHQAPAKRAHVDAEVLYLSAPTVPNFGHWMIDFLPRLRGRDHLPPGTRIAVPEDLGQKHLDTLALMGVSEADLIRCRRDTQYTFRTLHVFLPGRAMPPNPSHVHLVRRHFFKPIAASGPRPKRIFLARTSVGTRMIANHAEVQAVLDEAGFVSLEMADLTIAQQRDRLAEAEILLGAYGTNLLALYFAPAGCNVIALMDPKMEDPTIAHTAAVLGMKHQNLTCKAAHKSALARHGKDYDIVVDCDELRRRLAEIAADDRSAG
jgi:capsular polysaccharide biosynthesis protein